MPEEQLVDDDLIPQRRMADSIGTLQLFEKLVSLDAKMSAWIERMDASDRRQDDQEARLRLLENAPAPPTADHEQRLRALERWRYALPTTLVVAAASAAASIAAVFTH